MKLIIVGAGGHGRCCLDIAREKYDDIAFLDDNLIGQSINDCQVIGGMDDMEKFFPKYDNIFIAIGNNQMRMNLIEKAMKIGFNVVNLVSEKSCVSRYSKIGKGCVLFPGAIVEANAKIGNGTVLCANTVINHDAVVEDGCLIYSNNVIRPNASIGKLTRIGSNCTVKFGVKVEKMSDIEDGKVVI